MVRVAVLLRRRARHAVLLNVPVTIAARAPAATPAPVTAGAQNCSDDTFAIEGRTVRVSICSAAAPPVAEPKGRGEREGREAAPQLVLQETFTSGSVSFTRSLPVEIVAGSERSRAIDDVSLDKLGIGKTLHLTVGFRSGAVQLEHAMLVPGAIPLR